MALISRLRTLFTSFRHRAEQIRERHYIERLHLTHTTFKQMNERLPENFLQAHRSYVVNMKHVKEIERSVILMTDGTHISISDSNKDTFMQYLQRHGLKK